MKIETKVIHAGIEPDPSTGAIMTPIYQTSTYVQEAPGVHKGYEYARTQNPTRNALQQNIAALESAKHGFCFGSGLAAVDAITKLFKPGDEILSTNDLYGGTFRIFTKIFEPFGIKFKFVDLTNAEDLKKHITPNTKMIWIETPTNPMLSIVDIEAISKIAHANNMLVTVDNTFATPYLQQPMLMGADMVTHSATKYLGGHSDTVLGIVTCNSDDLADRLFFIQNGCGAVPGPMDCFLVLRGIKTLHVRMERHCDNAEYIAEQLSKHPKVDKVFHPMFPDHPNHAIAKKQMKRLGGMVSFKMKDDTLDAANKLLVGTTLFSLAESLGGVESLIGHPASMTHGAIPLEERLKTGVTDSLIRLSIGIENKEDLWADLSGALDQV
ncbi:UNVERIFIED_CONTAM: hypothetical protein GTU68_061420 [Idotea baltica]|nr:hypothetical protein [Idotea baltica]